jgi:AraC family transcriptional regulator of arabinose operon
MQGHIYLIDRPGHLVAYRHHANGRAYPLFTVFAVGIEEGTIDAVVDGQKVSERAAIVTPVVSEMSPSPDAIASFVFYPNSAVHRAMATLAQPRLRVFERDHFRRFDERLHASMRGALTLAEAEQLFDEVCGVLEPLLPPAPLLARSIAIALKMLEENPKVALSAIAQAASLSPSRLSHLFSQAIGIDMRNYRSWVKLNRFVRAAHSGLAFSELAELAGFADTAHLSRTIAKVFGNPASDLSSHLVTHIGGEAIPWMTLAPRSETLV